MRNFFGKRASLNPTAPDDDPVNWFSSFFLQTMTAARGGHQRKAAKKLCALKSPELNELNSAAAKFDKPSMWTGERESSSSSSSSLWLSHTHTHPYSHTYMHACHMEEGRNRVLADLARPSARRSGNFRLFCSFRRIGWLKVGASANGSKWAPRLLRIYFALLCLADDACRFFLAAIAHFPPTDVDQPIISTKI